MKRWVGFFICAILGLATLWCGLQMPVHLRAVDSVVLRKAGQDTPSLVEAGLALAAKQQLGAARLFLAAARSAWITNSHVLSEAVENLAAQSPTQATSNRLDGLLRANSEVNQLNQPSTPQSRSFAQLIVRSERRTAALELLRNSPSPLVEELLRSRALTNTVLFPPASSTSGQAYDAAIAMGALLAEDGRFSTGLSNAILAMARGANQGGNPQRLEQTLMDLLSLGQRFDWGEMATFVTPIADTETLRVLTALIRRDESVPVIYTAACLTTNPAGVANYLSHFSKTGLNDLRLSLNYGAGGVNQLLRSDRRLCDAGFCRRLDILTPGLASPVGLGLVLRNPSLALVTKWLLYLLGGFFIAAAFHCARRVPAREKLLEVRGFHLARELLFALGFLLVVLLLSEPFLSQGSQKVDFPFRLRMPTVGSAFAAATTGAKAPVMNNESNLIALLLFFVLQALLYTASLVKLSEIRRQGVAPRVKLKLLENEEHLFDAGLYLGFVGTIISLILFSLGVVKPSLMAAYSSTSFGIIFVSAFKIFNLRPLKRKLLLEAEAEAMSPTAPLAVPAYVTPS